MSGSCTQTGSCLATGAVWLMILAAPAASWFGVGHERAARLAVMVAAERLPPFFADHVAWVGHYAHDPDLWRDLQPGTQLDEAELPEHYVKLDLLEGMLPPTRAALVAWCCAHDLAPDDIGYLPYAVIEAAQRLTAAFAEHRRWPDNDAIRAQCLVQAGILAHYAADLCQPLHTTVDYDGRTAAAGVSPHSGIHLDTDSLLHRVPEDPNVSALAADLEPIGSLFDGVAAVAWASHALVGRVYELESALPGRNDPLPTGGAVEAFAAERLETAATFVARLFLTAWEDSAAVRIPPWHERPERVDACSRR